ncbi:MAG: hypothetical protein GY705_29410 [Bacteroidetes bacterium]|nr:hypothetical protein [Bacteroidota bacterium]
MQQFRNITIVIFWFTVFPIFLIAQSNEEIFSLVTQLRLAEHDTSKMDIYIKIADVYSSINAEKSIANARLAIILADNHKDYRRKLLALDKLIQVHLELKYDLPAAMYYLNEAKAIDTIYLNILDQAMLFGREGKIFMVLDEYEKSQDAFFKQLTIYEALDNYLGIAKVNFELGSLFFLQNDFKQAQVFYKSALERFTKLGDLQGRVETLNALGKTYGAQQDYVKNLEYCIEALNLANTLNDKPLLVNINTNIGHAYAHQNRHIDALKNYLFALHIGKEMENSRIIAGTAKEIGDIYHQQCDEPNAYKYYDTSIEAAIESKSKILEKNIYQSLFEFHDHYCRDSLAFYYLKKLTVIKDNLYSEERSRQLINNQIRYQSTRKDEENKLLRAKELENRITIQNQRFQNYALLFVIVLVLGVTFILYNAFQQKKAYNKILEQEVKNRTGELEKSNMKLSTSNQQLEQSNNELERFAYIASHDLKSPLRNIISFLNLIERKLKNFKDEDIKEYLRFATDNAKQMHVLIQDVLEFSRISNEDTSLEPVDMNETLFLVLQNLQELMKVKKAEVQVSELPVVRANSVHLLQLLQNLIGNGLKYNQNETPKVDIHHKEGEKFHVFSLKDNGIGISPEYHSKIFEMFKRLHNKETYSGTGIGLSVCKKVVDKLGGDIWLESEPGKGTTFFFSIPKNGQKEVHTSTSLTDAQLEIPQSAQEELA